MEKLDYGPVLRALERGETPVLRTVLTGAERGKTALLSNLPAPQPDCFDERLEQAPRLVILGGGHVAKALCQAAAFCGFVVTVLEQREELLTRERFPQAEELRKVDFGNMEAVLPTGPAYYAIITSGHEGDYVCAQTVLRRPFRYAGMIGSRAKVAAVRKKLAEAGIAPEILTRLHAPIGLDIGAQTPEEIAVSIAAELIQEKNRVSASVLPRELLAALKTPGCTGVLCTVIAKKGSVPRGVGSKLLLLPDGSIRGTVGGGKVEYLVIEHAGALHGFDVQDYSLAPGESAGMICGGQVRVMFQPIACKNVE